MMKNSFIVLLAVAVLAQGFALPKRAHAILGIGDIVSDPLLEVLDTVWQAIDATFQAADTYIQKYKILADFARWAKEDMMKSIRDIVAKRIMDYIVDQTVQWIQGGGKPKFVTDWKSFLRDAGDIAFDSVIKDLGIARLCDPLFLPRLQFILANKRFSTSVSCTLDKIVGNIRNFYNDFRNGGWVGYTEIFYPENNIYGQTILAYDELARRTMDEQSARQNEAISGGGYLNFSKCVEPEWATTDIVECDEFTEDGLCAKERVAGQKTEQVGCKKYETQTPGSTIGKAIGEAVTSDTQWAANIQSWTAALVNAAINRVIKEGILGITSFVSQTPSWNAKPDYNPTAGTPYENVIRQSIAAERERFAKDARGFLSTYQTVLGKKAQSLILVTRTQATLQSMQGLNCPSPVTQAELNNGSNEVARLRNEVNAMQASTTILQNALATLASTTDELSLNLAVASTTPIIDQFRSEENQLVTQVVDGFPVQVPITPAYRITAAENERLAKNSDLLSAQARLNSCSFVAPPPGS